MAFPEPLEAGAEWSAAEIVVIFFHGEGETAETMRDLADEIASPGVRYILPRAEGGRWFPKDFHEPLQENQPFVDAAIAHYSALIDQVRARGIGQDRIVLGGFSQGASLTAEYLVRYPKSYGAAFILTGGMMDEAVIGRRPGSGLLAVPVYISAGETDPLVPIQRVRDTIRTLQAGGALITSHIFTERPHLICADEIAEMRKILAQVKQAAEPAA